MGAFDDAPNIVVPDDDADPKAAEAFRKKWRWDPGEQVILKGEYLAADHEAVQNANSPATSAGQGKKNKEVETRFGSGHMKILERMIVGWTFTRNGRPVELTPANIRRLKSNYMTPLLEKCDEISTGMVMDEEEQEDFLPSSSAPTKENSAKTK